MPQLPDHPIFNRIREERGGVAEIHSAFSRFPSGIEGHYELYRRIMLEPDLPLSRWERECLAVATSRANACPYCLGHHAAALESAADPADRPSPSKIAALESLATTIAREPHRASALRASFEGVGYAPAQWEHAVMVASYFNFANRLAHAMGLELESGFELTCRA